MVNSRIFVMALSAAALVSFTMPAASAPKFDGRWMLTAVTTNGHCGIIPVPMAIARGRIHATGGSFAFNPIQLSGHVSASGGAAIKAVTGPRLAIGAGRFNRVQGQGTWKGKGPSGLCSGVWTATRF